MSGNGKIRKEEKVILLVVLLVLANNSNKKIYAYVSGQKRATLANLFKALDNSLEKFFKFPSNAFIKFIEKHLLVSNSTHTNFC